MDYYLGIDAGGTKTFCLAGDEEGRILGFGRGATGNYEVHGTGPALIEIRRAVEGALSSAGLELSEIAGIGMGIAGADVPEDYEMLEQEIFTPLLGSIPRCFRNDSMGGLRGGIREPKGIVIACGTGCVCAGVNAAGQAGRVGGLGETFGDKVSGTSIGLEGLYSVFRARDGIYGTTLLTEKYVERAGCADVDELFYGVYRGEITRERLEPMAVLVFEAAAKGDEAAGTILESGGRYLGEMVNGVAGNLAMCEDAFDVVMAGSVFKGKSPILKDAMATVIHRKCPWARLVMPAFEPVVGALLLGIELDHVVTDAIYSSLSRELDSAEERYGIRLKAEHLQFPEGP